MLGLLGRKNKEVTMVEFILLFSGIAAMVVSLLIKHKY